jgi:hypothetical protein
LCDADRYEFKSDASPSGFLEPAKQIYWIGLPSSNNLLA